MIARLFFATLILLPSLLVADDATQPTAEQLAARTFAVIDTIAANHISAPPRQEIVRQTITAIRRVAKMDPLLGLGPHLSTVTEDAEFREILTKEWEQVQSFLSAQKPVPDSRAILSQAIVGLLRVLPGQNRLSNARAHKVERQLAANRYVGTGIQITGARDGKPPVMTKVFPSGPADKAGAIDGDVIVEIDGVSTDGLSLTEVIRMLRGPDGADVEVLLQQQDDEPRRYTITRGVVPIKQTHVQRRMLGEHAVDVIRFDRLTSATVSDLREIERDAETRPAAVLLDLQIGEHDLHQAVLLADALLEGGTIGRLETVAQTREFEAGGDALFGDVRLFVIVSSQTSGTVEWIAAALQDHKRATLIGRQTVGQPYVSEAFDVPSTDWVVTLTSGVLSRADGGRLLRSTFGPSDRWQQPVVITTDPQSRVLLQKRARRTHDGGVIPDHLDELDLTRQRNPRQAGPQLLAPVSVDDSLKVVKQLLHEDK